MASSSPLGANFDAAAFRTNIQNTMLMGLPEAVAERPTFIKKAVLGYPTGTALDEQGKPYDMAIQPNVTPQIEAQALCAVEFAGAGEDNQSVGRFDKGNCVLTLLDVDYATIKGSTQVRLGGDTVYEIHYVEPGLGLFGVTIYRLHCETADEK